MPTARRIVSLTGPSGNGKSSLAVRLVADLGPAFADRVPTDWYLLSGERGQSGATGYGWDWERLAADLRGPCGQEVRTPAFDFTAMRRSESGSVKVFVLRPIMIVDAMRPFPGADLTIWLDVPAGARRERLAQRDQRWGTTVLDRWHLLEASHAMGAPAPADIVLDGRLPLAELSRQVGDALSNSFGDLMIGDAGGR